MKTFKEEFENYMERVYPDGYKPNQLEQVRQAYLGGALLIMAAVHAIADMSEEDAQLRIFELEDQLTEMTKEHLVEMKGKKDEIHNDE